MKRLQFLAAALLTLAVSQFGRPHKPGQSGIETVVQARASQPEFSPAHSEPRILHADSRLPVRVELPPPCLAILLPPWEDAEPMVWATEEFPQAQQEIAELTRAAPRIAPPVQP
jgi:hypothetical protein